MHLSLVAPPRSQQQQRSTHRSVSAAVCGALLVVALICVARHGEEESAGGGAVELLAGRSGHGARLFAWSNANDDGSEGGKGGSLSEIEACDPDDPACPTPKLALPEEAPEDGAAEVAAAPKAQGGAQEGAEGGQAAGQEGARKEEEVGVGKQEEDEVEEPAWNGVNPPPEGMAKVTVQRSGILPSSWEDDVEEGPVAHVARSQEGGGFKKRPYKVGRVRVVRG